MTCSVSASLSHAKFPRKFGKRGSSRIGEYAGVRWLMKEPGTEVANFAQQEFGVDSWCMFVGGKNLGCG